MPLALQPRRKNRLRPDVKEVRIAREKPPVRRRPDMRYKERVLRAKERVGWWLMLPFGVLSVFAFVEMFFKASVNGSLLTSSESVCFLAGAAVWMGMFFWLRPHFSIFYVFAHEVTHMISALMCGAVIYNWHVGKNGGWVDTNKSNTFISLSPYIIPFYTLVVVLAFGIAGLFLDLSQVHALHIGSTDIPINTSKVFHYLVGMTWAFHLSFTIVVMRDEQGDLVRNGQFFSVWLIALVNLYLMMWFLIVASPGLHWSDVWQSITGLATNFAGIVYDSVSWIVTHVRAEYDDMAGIARQAKTN